MVKRSEIQRGEVYWVNMDPSFGTEIGKIRPAVIVSADDLNESLSRVIIAPLTSKGRALGCRPELKFKGKKARILLDQLKSIDKRRITKKMGSIDQKIWLPTLLEMFA